MILPLSKLPDIKLQQLKNYPNSDDIIKIKVSMKKDGSDIVEGEVWKEDPVNYHYFIVDEEHDKILLGLVEKSTFPSFEEMYNEYRRMNK